MGCQVQLSVEQPYIRTDYVLLNSLLHVVRGIIFIALSFAVTTTASVLLGIGIVELIVAWWFWSMKIEAWGVSAGMSLFHVLFPETLGVSLIAGAFILVVCGIQFITLGIIRNDGGYSFVRIANVDTQEVRNPGDLQRRVFGLAVLAQLLKSFFVLLGAILLYPILGLSEPIPWLSIVPVIPTIIILGSLDLLAGIAMYLGRDWAFQLTVILVPLSFIETMLTLLSPVFLIAVWILFLLNTCLAKDGFYYKLNHRFRKNA
ncbi:hypothetical protein EU528_03520 [Candidatus Thorarchaeota archaeon]|nr:MAG: hypothetical protein EU528_03520 [Candidatus Thorarchaeota archaeon]